MELMDCGGGEGGEGGVEGEGKGISFKEKQIPRDKNSIILPRVYI